MFFILGLCSCGDKADFGEVADGIQPIIEKNEPDPEDNQVEVDKAYCEVNEEKTPYAGGEGSDENPYSICSVEQFNEISKNEDDHDKSFELRADLDFTDTTFEMISDSSSGFSGTFDGKDHSMSNVTLSESGVEYVGVFKKIAVSGVVKNLSLVDVDIVGGNYVGAIAGFSSGKIDHCHSSGNISGGNNTGGLVGRAWGTDASLEGVYNSSSSATISGGQWTGGVVGWSRNVKFEKIFFTGDITSGSRSGGLVGVADGATEIVDSYSTGDIVSSGYLVGGIVGGMNGSITSSYSTGSVTGATGYIGGIAGTFEGTLSKSYSSSDVHLTGAYVAGGLVGYLYASSSIENSYFKGSVNSSHDYIGGIVGYNAGSPISYTFSISTTLTGNDPGGIQGGTAMASSASVFWDADVSGIVGDFTDDMVTKVSTQAKTTTELKTVETFSLAGYDSTIWNLVSGEYPTLK